MTFECRVVSEETPRGRLAGPAVPDQLRRVRGGLKPWPAAAERGCVREGSEGTF